jgi:hypothetical protein
MVEQLMLNNLLLSTILSLTILTAYYIEENAAGILFGIIIGTSINYLFANQILGIITTIT